jgi:hypothetical protein
MTFVIIGLVYRAILTIQKYANFIVSGVQKYAFFAVLGVQKYAFLLDKGV